MNRYDMERYVYNYMIHLSSHYIDGTMNLLLSVAVMTDNELEITIANIRQNFIKDNW
jgi:hypothetical protein